MDVIKNIFRNPGHALEAARTDKSRAFYYMVKIAVFAQILVYEFRRNHCTSRASGIAFVLLITLIPLIATAAFFVAGIADISTEQVERAISAFLPFAPPTVMDYIVTFFINAQSLRGIGIGILIIMAMSLFNIVEQALNSIWKIVRPRSFFKRLRTFTMVIVYSPVLFYVSYRLRHSGVFGVLPEDIFVMRLPPIIFTILAFATMIWSIPNTKVRASSAIIGGIVSCLLFELERWGFGYYVNFSIQTHTIYGTFGLIVFFLLSLYFTALLFLLGAQVAHIHQHFRPLLRAAQRRDRRVSDYRSYISIRMLIDCVRAFMKNEDPPTIEFFCEKYELSTQQAAGILNWLIHENFIHEINRGKQFVPARNFAAESVSAVFSAIEDQNRRIPVTPNDTTKEYLAEFMIEYGKRRCENDMTLGELIETVDGHQPRF